MKTGKCSSCGKVPMSLRIESVELKGSGITYLGVQYVCPTIGCGNILGVQMDPIALKSDTIAEIARKLGR